MGRVGRQGDVAHTGVWFDRLRDGDFTRTVLSSAGAGHGWVAIAPFLLLVVVALGLAAAATTWPRVRPRDLVGAAVALAGWALCVHFLPRLLHDDYGARGLGAGGAIVAVAAGVGVTIAAIYAGGASTSTSERPAVASSSKT